MKHNLCSLLMASLFVSPFMLTPASAQAPGRATWPLEVKVTSNKNDRLNKSGEIDDRNVEVKLLCEVLNKDGKRSLEGAKVTLMAIGRDVVEKDNLLMLNNDSSTMTIAPSGKQSLEGKSARLRYDDKAYAQHGFKYYGYLVVVQDSKGATLLVKGNPAGLDAKPDKAMGLKAGMQFDRKTFEATANSASLR